MKCFLFSLSLLLTSGLFLAAPAQQPNPPSTPERKLTVKTFAEMPVRVLKIKNLQSETWPSDLEIEIKNVSLKPIYFLRIVLEFPDDPAPNGSSGILLEFGKTENMDIGVIAGIDDPHLDPGKTVLIRAEEIYRKGLMAKQTIHPENFMKMKLWFSIISFGDGTGYSVSDFLDLRKKK